MDVYINYELIENVYNYYKLIEKTNVIEHKTRNSNNGWEKNELIIQKFPLFIVAEMLTGCEIQEIVKRYERKIFLGQNKRTDLQY